MIQKLICGYEILQITDTNILLLNNINNKIRWKSIFFMYTKFMTTVENAFLTRKKLVLTDCSLKNVPHHSKESSEIGRVAK